MQLGVLDGPDSLFFSQLIKAITVKVKKRNIFIGLTKITAQKLITLLYHTNSCDHLAQISSKLIAIFAGLVLGSGTYLISRFSVKYL